METIIDQDFSERVKILLKEKFNNNKSKFSRYIDRSPSQLHNILNNGGKFTQSTLFMLNNLGVNLNWLVSGVGERYINGKNNYNNDVGLVIGGTVGNFEKVDSINNVGVKNKEDQELSGLKTKYECELKINSNLESQILDLKDQIKFYKEIIETQKIRKNE